MPAFFPRRKIEATFIMSGGLLKAEAGFDLL
jgi:hypothetical protein